MRVKNNKTTVAVAVATQIVIVKEKESQTQFKPGVEYPKMSNCAPETPRSSLPQLKMNWQLFARCLRK